MNEQELIRVLESAEHDLHLPEPYLPAIQMNIHKALALIKEAGGVKLAEDQTFSHDNTGNVSLSDCSRCFEKRCREGWRKVEVK